MTVQRETECSWQCNGIRGPRRRSLAIRRATERQDRTNGQRSALGGAMGYGNRDGVPRLSEGGYGASMTGSTRNGVLIGSAMGYGDRDDVPQATRGRLRSGNDRTNGQRSAHSAAAIRIRSPRLRPQATRRATEQQNRTQRKTGRPRRLQSGYGEPRLRTAGYPREATEQQ